MKQKPQSSAPSKGLDIANKIATHAGNYESDKDSDDAVQVHTEHCPQCGYAIKAVRRK